MIKPAATWGQDGSITIAGRPVQIPVASIFECAYLLAYDAEISEKETRRWHSWDDYTREWCRRPDFCAMPPQLLEGEDPDFVACITTIAEEEHAAAAHRAHARLS